MAITGTFRCKSLMWIWLLAVTSFMIATAQTSEEIANFTKWARRNGAEFEESLAWPVNFTGFGRGVAADRSLQVEEIFLRVPLSLCLSKHYAVNTALVDVVKEVSDFQATVLLLMFEKIKNDDSFWAPYIAVLPKRFESTMVWTDEELDMLQDGYLKSYSKASMSNIEIDYLKVHDVLDKYNIDTEQYVFDRFYWAWLVVGTRGFSLKDHTTHGLVPVADFLNHAAASSVTWNVRNPFFEMQVGSAVTNAQKLVNKYCMGDASNAHIMTHFGFVDSENQDNFERVLIPKTNYIMLYRDKRIILRTQFGARAYFLVRPHDLMQRCRIIAEDDYQVLRSPQRAANTWVANYAGADRCKEIFVDELKAHSPSVGMEYVFLRDPEQTQNDQERTIVRYRIERKKAITRNIEFLEMVMYELLPCVPSHTVKRPKFLRKLNEVAQQYFAS